MNREQIIEKWNRMTPRERDAWVAEAVFGWSKYDVSFRTIVMPHPDDARWGWTAIWDEGGRPHWLPHYSTDISAAWDVFECHPYVEVARIPGKGITYGVRINNSDDGTVCAMTQKPTFPEAIGLAAIIAKLI